MEHPGIRDQALAELRARNRQRKPWIRLIEAPEYRAMLAALTGVEAATRFLHDIKAALERNTPIPRPFHDHQLSGALRRFRSVIAGDLDSGEITFPLVYRRSGGVTDLVAIAQHSDVYEREPRR